MSDMHDFGQFILERHAALGGITEVRILHQTASGRKAVKNGYFTPAELPLLLTLLAPVPGGPRSRLPHHAHPRSGEANIYFSLQAVKPEIAASRIGSISSAQHTTRDQDILAYTLFVVDIDPVRPSGVSATDEEKEASRLVLDDVTCWFQERGINGIEADSGNGYHLLIPLISITGDAIHKAADDAHTLLKLLDEQFSTPQAKVDTSTFNPSRILKFYGTKAVKGEHTGERPHRYASINLEEIPEDIALFSLLKSELSAFRSRKKSTRRGTMSLVSCTTHASSTHSIGAGDDSHKSLSFRDWKNLVLQKLPLETIYGPLLQTARSQSGWIVCRDPRSPTGDQNPSAGVADAVVGIERGTFHSFSRGDSMSVFHFMTMQAQTQSLVESYVKVGELVGIPYQSDRSSADALTEEFSRTWPELPDDNSRYSLIESTLAEAVKLSPLQRAKVMSQLKLLTGLSARTLQEVEYQVKQESRQNPQERKLSGAVMRNRVVVDYCSNADPVSLLFDNLVRAMEPRHVLFRCEDGMCAVRREKGPISVTERNLPGILSANVELRFTRLESGREEFSRYGVLPPELARSFLYDEEVLSQLPLLKLYTRSPLFAHRWQFIGTPGYHSDGYYYDGPAFTVKPAAEPGIPFHLREVLNGFHFASEVDRINYLGLLLTSITLPLWGRGHPFVAINGNKPGVGKSTLARVLAMIFEGHEPYTLSYTADDTELEKRLATRVAAGDHVIIVDNVNTPGSVRSAVLERTITDTRPSFRRLGTLDSVTREQNDLLLVLTMNFLQLGADIRRRAVPIQLHLDKHVRAVRYQFDDILDFVSLHRKALLEELCGLVMRWLEEGRPLFEDTPSHSAGYPWASAIDGILRTNGLNGFLTNLDTSLQDSDPHWDLIRDIVTHWKGASPAHASTWVSRLEQSQHHDRFLDRNGQDKTPRAKATIVGSFFSAYLDAVIPVGKERYQIVRTFPEGDAHKPTYHVEVL